MKSKKTKPVELAGRAGIHTNLAIALQRAGVLPADPSQFSSKDRLFVEQFRVVMSSKKLLGLQLLGLPKTRREELAALAKDWRLRRWEKWALRHMINLYVQKLTDPTVTVDVADVLYKIASIFGTLSTPWVTRRIERLNLVARKRVETEAKRQLS